VAHKKGRGLAVLQIQGHTSKLVVNETRE